MFTTTVLSTSLFLLESEKLRTRASSVAFFQFYSQVNTIFLPVEYVERALEMVHADNEPVQQQVLAFLHDYLGTRPALASEGDCVESMATNKITKRVVVLGLGIEDATFLNIDLFLNELATTYEYMLRGEARKMSDAFAKHETDNMTLEQFKALVNDVHDTNANRLSDEAVANMYSMLMMVGNGSINMHEFQEMLAVLTTRKKAEVIGDVHLDIAAPEHADDAKADLQDFSNGWDSVRASYEPVDPRASTNSRFTCTPCHECKQYGGEG